MAKVIRRRWITEADLGVARRDRQSCDYEAYVPDLLTGRKLMFEGSTAADIADAERAVAVLDAQASTLADTEALARLLLRAECVASSRIEGLEVGARRLLRAEAAIDLGEQPVDVTAAEVLGNIEAMASAVKQIMPGEPITVDILLDFHKRLLRGTRLDAHAGRIRSEQNWIGGSDHNPCSATFIPPPPEYVIDLLEDLCSFCNDDVLPAVAQAAMAHSQFETIHPFVDGNGRTGRALIHFVLRRRGLATRVLPPISLVLATWAKDYVDGLQATRYRGPASSIAAQNGINLWVARFAAACLRAVVDASDFEKRSQLLQEEWRAKLGPVRANSATDLLLRALPGAPLLTVKSAAALIGRTFVAANEAIKKLVDAEILRPVSVGHRNRAFEATGVIEAFTALERQLASPKGNTLTSEPSRRVPYRPASAN
ncbi:MAG TPA: Fic family protein [Streptosporangiaceae bacterium]|nr:Fic family protein [Streptosporangiaceae bacterium]